MYMHASKYILEIVSWHSSGIVFTECTWLHFTSMKTVHECRRHTKMDQPNYRPDTPNIREEATVQLKWWRTPHRVSDITEGITPYILLGGGKKLYKKTCTCHVKWHFNKIPENCLIQSNNYSVYHMLIFRVCIWHPEACSWRIQEEP